MAPRESESVVSIYHFQDKHLAFEMKQESLQKHSFNSSISAFVTFIGYLNSFKISFSCTDSLLVKSTFPTEKGN